MVRAEIIRKRLNKLDEYLSILHELQRYRFEEFIADPDTTEVLNDFYIWQLKRSRIWEIISLQA
jgi:hypothetical protein